MRVMAMWPPANPITFSTLTPDLTHLPALNLWALVAFAFTGIELAATTSDEIRDPRRSLPRSLAVAAALIMAGYLLGTLSVVWALPTAEVNVVSGFLQAIAAVTGPAAGPWLGSFRLAP